MKISVITLCVFIGIVIACNEQKQPATYPQIIIIDTSNIPKNAYGEAVTFGRELMLNTAYYIGPNGIKGNYLGNHISCTNCHQQAGTKPFSFNLIQSHDRYPQYRAREGKVLSLAERVNNCIMRPGNGKPLPLDGKEMIAFLSYLKWINEHANDTATFLGNKNLDIQFPDRAADPKKGELLYKIHCIRCHQANGEGKWNENKTAYEYPPLWGSQSYQPGSSMHRIIKQAQWLKANMPHDIATWEMPLLTDEDALDVAAFVNDDRIHPRPNPKTFDYPKPEEKAIDYGIGPFADNFNEEQHKFGPYKPIIADWKKRGLEPRY